MIVYSKQLNKAIIDYSLHLERQMQDAMNPKASVAGSFLRMTFRTVATGDRALSKIYDRLRWELKDISDPSTRIEQIAAIAEKNGNAEAAARLRRCMAVVDNVEAQCDLKEDASVWQGLKAMKKLNKPYQPG